MTDEIKELLSKMTPEQANALISALIEEGAKADPEAMAEIINAVSSEMEVTSTMWKNGIEPMPFDEFCVALDGNALFPRQKQAFSDAGLLRASNIFSKNKKVNEAVLLWGKGTLSDDTILQDAVTQEAMTVEEWCESGKSLHVKSLLGNNIVTLPTSPVFCKGEAETYTVELNNGHKVSVSPNHKFLTPNGWVEAKHLVVGVSSVFHVPLEHEVSCVQNHSTPQDYQGDCLSGSHFCDEPLHFEASFCPSDVPLLLHAPLREYCRREDGNDKLSICTVPCGASLDQMSKNCADAYRPLVKSTHGESFHLGFDVSPLVHRVLDLYCSLPLEDKEFLQDVFACQELAQNEDELQCLHLAFVEKLYSCLCEASQQSLRFYIPVDRDRLYDSSQHPAVDTELQNQHQQTLDAYVLLRDLSSTYSQSDLLSDLGCVVRESCQLEYQGVLSSKNGSFVKVVSIIPHGFRKIYDLTVPVANNYFDTSGVLHSNSGKDMTSSKFICYLAYCMLHINGDVGEVLGAGKGSKIAILNVAPSEQLAYDVFFEPYLSHYIKESELFKPFIFDEAAQITKKEIHFPQIRLSLWSKSSNPRTLDGYNVFAFVLDEADAFMDSSSGKNNAEEVVKILRSSASTRFGNAFIGFIISYPRTVDGFMMKTYERAVKDDNSYADRGASWDINLKISRETPSIKRDYEDDPSDARMRYECIPRMTDSAFFEMPEKIDEAVDHTRVPICEVISEDVVRVVTGSDGEPVEMLYIGAVLDSVPHPTPGFDYFMSVDGGLSGDSYAIAVFHADKVEEAVGYFCPSCGSMEELRTGATYIQISRNNIEEIKSIISVSEPIFCGMCYENPSSYNPMVGLLGWWKRMGVSNHKPLEINGKKINIPHVYEDLLVEIKPFRATRNSEKSKVVDYVSVQKLCEDLIKALNIQSSRFDPWNSASIVQGLQASTNTDAQQISYSQPEQYKRARLVKAMTYSNLITLLPNEKRDREWKKLTRNGTKIDHPKTGSPPPSKDLYDAESVAIWLAATSQCNEMEFKF